MFTFTSNSEAMFVCKGVWEYTLAFGIQYQTHEASLLHTLSGHGFRLHFSNLKTASEIEYKLKSYLHHREFDENPLSVEEINGLIKNKQAIYDLRVDKRVNKIGDGSKLEKYPIEKLPKFLQDNLNNYKEWIDWYEKRILG